MRKLALVLAAGMVLGALSAPAVAGGKKPVHGSFQATALPFPKLTTWGDPIGLTARSCLAGVEGVHKVSHAFAAPYTGTLKATMEGFTGDWDLFITDADGKELIGSYNDQILGDMTVGEEVTYPLKAKQQVNIVACNWLGAPQAEAHYLFGPTKK